MEQLAGGGWLVATACCRTWVMGEKLIAAVTMVGLATMVLMVADMRLVTAWFVGVLEVLVELDTCMFGLTP